MMNDLVHIENLEKTYTTAGENLTVLKNLSIANARGSFNSYYFPYLDSVSDYILKNGGGFTGGAIYNNGFLTIENCVFENNTVWNISNGYPANTISLNAAGVSSA